ncbi:MAG: 8-amino-7-oxononanoate synthase [Microcystaceae cyanobacterium]
MTANDPAPYEWIDRALQTIHRADWYRSVKEITTPSGPVIRLNGKELINFASNDYLGLANDPRLKAAAIQAIQDWGTGSTGSRLLSGHRALHSQLETAIADVKGTEAALVFSSGYLANLGTITAIADSRDLILGDEYNHSSLKNGAKLSGASYQQYRHGDRDDLAEQLQKYRQNHRRCLILSDSVFSMDGDLCPLPDLIELAQSYHCMLLIDEAHGTGVMGRTGAGCREYFDCLEANLIQVGTLSKALGSLGGYVAGSSQLIDYLRNRAASWIYTTALSPADTAAAIAALQVIKNEPERLQRLWSNVAVLKDGLGRSGLKMLPSASPIICVELANPKQTLNLSAYLESQGIFVPAIRPPTVPTSRLRFTVMANHSLAHLEQVAIALANVEF